MKLSKAKILILNISDLAKEYGCSRPRIYTILNGNTVRTSTAGKLAQVLKVSVADILED